jgi:hypothetical protein
MGCSDKGSNTGCPPVRRPDVGGGRGTCPLRPPSLLRRSRAIRLRSFAVVRPQSTVLTALTIFLHRRASNGLAGPSHCCSAHTVVEVRAMNGGRGRAKVLAKDLSPPILVRFVSRLRPHLSSHTGTPPRESPAEWSDAAFDADEHWHLHYSLSPWYFVWTVIVDRLQTIEAPRGARRRMRARSARSLHQGPGLHELPRARLQLPTPSGSSGPIS